MYKQYWHIDVLNHIRESVKDTPEKTAVYVGERGISYQELFSLSEQIASGMNTFISEFVKRKNDVPVRIGVYMRRNERVEASILSIIKLGCTYVPIDTETPRDRVAFIAEDASLAFFLTEDAVKERLPQDVPSLTIEDILKKETSDITADYSTDDIYFRYNR